MLLGVTLATAGATVPVGMAALGDDRLELQVRDLVSSPSGNIVVACTEDKVVGLAGSAPDVDLPGGGLAVADVADSGWMALFHLGGVTIHDNGGREMLRLGGYTGSLADLTLSPDGLTFAVASNDKVALHRTADGLELWSWRGQAYSVTFHPDGKKVIAGIDTGNLVLNAENGKVVNGFDTEPAVWFRWTDDALYTHEQVGPLKAWDPVTLKPLENQATLRISQTAAVHPDASWLLVDGCVAVAGASRPTSLCVDVGAVASAFDEEGALYVASEGLVQRWTPLGDRRITDLGLPPGGPRVVEIAAADGGDWVVVTTDGAVQRLAADGSAKFQATVPGCESDGCAPRAVGSFGPETWVLGPAGELQVWSASGEARGRAKRSKVRDAGRLPDGTWVALMEDGRVRISPKLGKGSPVADIPDARELVVGTQGFVVVGEQVHPFKATGVAQPVAKLGPDRVPRAVTTDETGLALAVLDDQGAVHRFSADGRPVFRESLGIDGQVEELAWSADGAWLVVGGSPLRVFDASDGSPHMDILLTPPGSATGLATSPFGFIGVVQGTAQREEVRLVRLKGRE